MCYVVQQITRKNPNWCNQGRNQKYKLGGGVVKGWGLVPSPPLGSPSPSRPVPFP